VSIYVCGHYIRNRIGDFAGPHWIRCLSKLRNFDRLPWIKITAYVHSQRGAIDCGHSVAVRDEIGAETVVRCALSAHSKGRPAVAIFTTEGTDLKASNAIVGDSEANTLEIVYAPGLVANHGNLLKRRCDRPVQLLVYQATTYDLPTLHCAPWPSSKFERDYFLW
jgi:hypothetical protein